MRRVFLPAVILALSLQSIAFPCFNPTDLFAVEVLLNKPGITWNLNPIRGADNISLSKEGIVYRSHFDNRIAVILEEINEKPLQGLSVRIQIPTKHLLVTLKRLSINFTLQDSSIDRIDEAFLKSLGYEVNYARKDDTLSLSLRKGDISLVITQYEEVGRSRVEFRAQILNSEVLTDEIKEEFERIIESLGLEGEALDKAELRVIKEQVDDLVEAVDVKRESFNFKSAMKVELEWLKDNGIISGIQEKDISEISKISKAGAAGWNSRIVYEDGRWIPYYETDNPMLLRKGVDCGGFPLEEMPEGGDLSFHTSILPKGKLSTTWGRIKAP